MLLNPGSQYTEAIPESPATLSSFEAWSYLSRREKTAWRNYWQSIPRNSEVFATDQFRRPCDLFYWCQAWFAPDSPDGWLHWPPTWYEFTQPLDKLQPNSPPHLKRDTPF